MPNHSELIEKAAGDLQMLLQQLRSGEDDELSRIVDAKDEVLGRFQPIFKPSNIPQLNSHDFASFLSFDNNKHWQGLNRQKSQITGEMSKLRISDLVL